MTKETPADRSAATHRPDGGRAALGQARGGAAGGPGGVGACSAGAVSHRRLAAPLAELFSYQSLHLLALQVIVASAGAVALRRDEPPIRTKDFNTMGILLVSVNFRTELKTSIHWFS